MDLFIMDYDNRIAEFYFLLHRHNIEQSQILLYDLLRTLSYDLRKSITSIEPTCEKQQLLSYLRILYGLIGQTRDIYCGRGERDLAYMMISTWYDFFPDLAIYAFYSFVFAIETTLYSCYPYGCWNDIKYFAKYNLRTRTKTHHSHHLNGRTKTHHPLISIIISYANRQLRKDIMMSPHDNNTDISNVAKWIPRETKMKKLYELFVLDWFNVLPENANNISFLKKQYRQIITDQCSKHSKHTTNKNVCKQIEQNKFIENIETDCNGIGRGYFHENLFIGDYVRCALAIVKQRDSMNIDICCNENAVWLNKKWQWILATFYKCYGGIPMIDISKEISDENLFHAIGFACLIAEKSGIRRIMLVSDMPIWIDLTDTSNFCMIIQRIWSHCDNPLRRAARFDIALDLIAKSIEYSDLSILDNAKLFIFSDIFDFDWYYSIKQFNCKMSIVFWNIGAAKKSRLQDVFAEDHRELIFISGSNIALMNPFCNTEILPLNGPFYFIKQIMDNVRYKPLYDFFDTFIEEYSKK